jgi:putative RecB family exonuclease
VSGSLSPSRASDFMTCPLLYRFRTIDRLPEPPTPAAVRGTVVHAVLEELFDLPANERSVTVARDAVRSTWEQLAAGDAELAAMFADAGELATWLDSCRDVLDGYFALEDPRRLQPARTECRVETVLDSGLRLHGYVDRLDVNEAGHVRIVDYKTGATPRVEFEAKALFQMRFYALVIWRTRGEVPTLLQLMYLRDREVLRYAPDEADLLATERKLRALWAAIERARAAGDWRPRPSRMCDFCCHRPICPAHGGTPPPTPVAD